MGQSKSRMNYQPAPDFYHVTSVYEDVCQVLKCNTLWSGHALVSPAISSNPAAPDCSSCKAPECSEKDIPYQSTKGSFRCTASLDGSRPHLTNGVTFHFLSATGKRSVPQRGAGSPLSAEPAPLSGRMWLTLVTEWSHRGMGVMHTHICGWRYNPPTYVLHS